MLHSLKYKLMLAMSFTSILAMSTVAVISPVILKKLFIDQAKEIHYTRFTNKIVRFIEKNIDWGTPLSANKFFLESEPPPFAPDAKEQDLIFGLVDYNGNILMEFRDYKDGDRVPESLLVDGDPLYHQATIIAYVIAEGPPRLGPKDTMFFEGLREAAFYGIIAAIILTLLLGYYWGNRLTRSLVQLTKMAKNLREELVEQQVDIKSNDEIGILAQVFNETSLKLANTHNQLIQSNMLIKEQAEELRNLSIHDELTGLYNRRFFNEQIDIFLSNAKRYDRPLSLVLGDIDYFKKINDTYSHLIGDQVLVKVSEIIKKELRSCDIVARFGGEEIIIALPETDPELSFSIIERIRDKLEKYNWSEILAGIELTMSFGICSNYLLSSYEKMIAIADENLYKAKENGRNMVILDKDL